MKPCKTRTRAEQSGAVKLAMRPKWPGTLGLALLLLACLAGVLETAARSPYVQEHLPPPSYGIANRQFEIQLYRLNVFARETGRVPCLFLGSSEVYRGIDPIVFGQALKDQTGQGLLCFNFGVKGLDPLNAEALARILVDLYNPALLVYGTDVAAFSTSQAQGFRGDLLQHAWIRYKLGEPTLAGWLIDHSYALRDYLVIRNWMKLNFWDQVRESNQTEAATTRAGFAPLDSTAENLDQPPGPAEKEANLFGALGQFEVSSAQLEAFDRLLGLDRGLRVIVVEMPLHPSFYQFFGKGKKDYDLGLAAVKQIAERHQVSFIATMDLNLVPDSGWYSRNHLNRSGATLFSLWLGGRLGQLATSEGGIIPPGFGGAAGETP